MPDIEFIENTKFSENTGIIDNMLNEFVEEDQVYKDKETVVGVMKNLDVHERFQFKVKRSSATSIVKDKYVNPKKIYTANDIIEDIQKQHGVEVSYMKAWRAKEIAMAMIRGNSSNSYKELLRPIMVVDGCFLKAAYKGTILTASTQDGAGKILPLAYAIVDSENNKFWGWFFVQIKGTFGVREGTCIVSDRNESIFNATKVVYPEVPHCICMFHLWQNVKCTFKKHHKQLKDIFFARAYTIEKFDYHMTEMCKIDPRVQPYLFEIGYERWSRAYSKVKRSMVMTSNITESINAANKDARELPVMRLLEYMTNFLQQ
ncbi:PREDICTED: uncharacterized protein LOC109235958 [Nicotiana attenuata]|uniref:uncharacterized protein LOC109235958 n=1 Tax=Nicotiana attenuata TaxID=49451 RepID=UPI000905BA46|nr:PREDICTED: uncharacterized protein LOC109235958 [Nicotiana attenuata]